MRIFIRYDKQGAVLAVAKSSTLHDGLDHPFADADAGAGESVIEVQETPALQALTPHEVHEQYRVDLKKKQLRKRSA
jgi:hypothetical protein